MRPDLIGERCSGCGNAGVLVQWVHGAESHGLILLDDGTLRFVDVEHLQFPPRTEQPDEPTDGGFIADELHRELFEAFRSAIRERNDMAEADRRTASGGGGE